MQKGIEAIGYFHQQYPSVPLLVLTGYPDMQLATDLPKQGVVDYLVKPADKDELMAAVTRAMAAGPPSCHTADLG